MKLVLNFKKILILASLVVLILVLLSGGLFFYSSSPSFCNLCHVMDPYYDAWKTSKHAQVACVKCHIPPQPKDAMWAKFQTISSVVHYVTKRYGTKPHAEIEDTACLRDGCHETRLLKGKVSFKRNIMFDHFPHLQELRREKRLRCTSCHSQIVVGSYMKVTYSTCYLCHFKGSVAGRKLTPLGGCPLCHQFPRENVEVEGVVFSHKDFMQSRKVACEKCHRDVIQGVGEASSDRCFNCHYKPERLAKYVEAEFMHKVHVENRNVDCLNCHHEIKHKKVPVKIRHQVRRCEICHSNTHMLTEAIMRGEGGTGTPQNPSHMFLARLDCASCHFLRKDIQSIPGGGQTMVVSERVCAQCHDEKWNGMLFDWKETLDRMLGDLKPKLQLAMRRMKGLQEDHPRFMEARALLDDASFNLDYVEKASGIHNPFYAAALIVVSNDKLDRMFEELGEKAPELPEASPIRGQYCAQLCHKKAGVEMSSQVTVDGKSLSHRKHAFDLKMGCTRCHSSEEHKALSIKREDCLNCHHRDAAASLPEISRQPPTPNSYPLKGAGGG